jgi:hypothetical protein
MTDPEVENTLGIRQWLNIITGRPHILEGQKGFIASLVMGLAQKYDCPVVATVTLSAMRQLIDSQEESPLAVAIFASLYHHYDLVARSIRISGHKVWGDVTPAGVKITSDMSVLSGENIWDPSAWSLVQVRRLSVDVLWALSRTHRLGGSKEERATRFLGLMKQLEGEHYLRDSASFAQYRWLTYSGTYTGNKRKAGEMEDLEASS